MVGQFSANHLKQCYVMGEFNKYIIKRKLHGCLEIQISLLMYKNIFDNFLLTPIF